MAARSTAVAATEEAEPGARPVEVELWRAVLLQAMIDASSTNQWKPDILRRSARLWLTRPSADLATVCDLAGLDPSWWLARVAPVLQRHWAALDAAAAPPRTYRGRTVAAAAYGSQNADVG